MLAGTQARELELLSAALLLGDDHQLSVNPVAAEQPIEELALLCQASFAQSRARLMARLRWAARGPSWSRTSAVVRPLPCSGQRPARRGSHCGSCCPDAWTPESGELQPTGFPVHPSQLLLELLDIASDTAELAALARCEQHRVLLFNPVTHCQQTGVLLPRP